MDDLLCGSMRGVLGGAHDWSEVAEAGFELKDLPDNKIVACQNSKASGLKA
jgi:hypothetical protein